MGFFQVSLVFGVVRTLVVNCGEMAHLSVGNHEFPLTGDELRDKERLIHQPGLAILIEDGMINKIADSADLISEFAPWFPEKNPNADIDVIDINGKSVVPGFVDCHTHLVWDGDRSDELSLRIRGKSYKDIAAMGGGINKTVSSTRVCPEKTLFNSAMARVNEAIRNGTTTLEAKSGYGLDLNTEIKILEVISKVNRDSECNIFPTWLGAHDFPKEMSKKEYIEHLISEQLPIVSELGLAKWTDVFCEEGWFNLEETERIVKTSEDLGMKSRLHVDEFTDSGGLQLASELGSISGDHAACSDDSARDNAADAGTMQTFLPGTPYVLGTKLDLPINRCIDEEWTFAVATDFNPNCPIISLPHIGSILCHRMRIDPIVALAAVTRNPATTIFDSENPRGIIAEGRVADLNILRTSSVDSWCQTPGSSPVERTMISGNIVNFNRSHQN